MTRSVATTPVGAVKRAASTLVTRACVVPDPPSAAFTVLISACTVAPGVATNKPCTASTSVEMTPAGDIKIFASAAVIAACTLAALGEICPTNEVVPKLFPRSSATDAVEFPPIISCMLVKVPPAAPIFP